MVREAVNNACREREMADATPITTIPTFSVQRLAACNPTSMTRERKTAATDNASVKHIKPSISWKRLTWIAQLGSAAVTANGSAPATAVMASYCANLACAPAATGW